METLSILLILYVTNVYYSFGNVLPTDYQASSSDYEGPWIRYSQPNVEIIPHDPIVERGANLTLRCVAHGIKNLHDYAWEVPIHMLMERFKLADRDKKRTLEVFHLSDEDHDKTFICNVKNNFGQMWSKSVTVRILELMQPHPTQTVIFGRRTVNYMPDNRNAKSERRKHSSGIGTAIGVGLVMAFVGIVIGIIIAVNIIRRRHASKVPNLDRAAKRRQPGRSATVPDEHYMSLNQPTKTSSTASSERYHVDLRLGTYHQKTPQPPALPPPRVTKPVPPSRRRHHKNTAGKLHKQAMANTSKSMDSVYDTMKRSYQIQEYVKPTELEYGSCEYIDMLANLRNPPLQQSNNNNQRTVLVDTYTTPVELFRDN